MRELHIDEEFRSLLSPLSEDEYKALEASILEDGFRESIVVWEQGNVILDGHNRYEIAMANGFSMDVIPIELRSIFRDRAEAMVWMIDNQRGRRNLSKQQLLDLGMKRAALLEAKAKENRAHGQTAPGKTLCQKSDKAFEHVDTLGEAAKFAGVSRDTASKYKKVMTEAPEAVRQEVKSGKTSINKAYKDVRRVSSDMQTGRADEKKQGYELALRFTDKLRKELASVSDKAKVIAIAQISQWLEEQK